MVCYTPYAFIYVRYLIVIDDIWEAFAWDIIRCALPESINGSRVLITTRIETVARGCCAKNIECVYKMKALSDQDSRVYSSKYFLVKRITTGNSNTSMSDEFFCVVFSVRTEK